MNNIEQKAYWEKRIDRFDAIYDDNKGLRELTFASKLVEPFRKSSLLKRFDCATQYLKDFGISGKTFIDGGCGTGRMTEFLLHNGASRVDAIDITSRAVDLAGERVSSSCPDKLARVSFTSGDITQVKLNESDCFVGLGLVEYLDDIDKFISNIKSRHIIINYPLKYHWKRIVRVIVEYFENSHRHYYAPREMEQIFKNHSFKLVKRIYFGASSLEVYMKID